MHIAKIVVRNHSISVPLRLRKFLGIGKLDSPILPTGGRLLSRSDLNRIPCSAFETGPLTRRAPGHLGTFTSTDTRAPPLHEHRGAHGVAMMMMRMMLMVMMVMMMIRAPSAQMRFR